MHPGLASNTQACGVDSICKIKKGLPHSEWTLGLTYTRDEVVQARLIKFQQDDLFSSTRLVKVLNSMSKLRREIYPVRLSDIEVH